MSEQDSRFSRFELIDWWDQQRLRQARVVVIGAGALGNEIVKNCALLGIGELVIVDFDAVETSNLSRSVLFRESDAGTNKAAAAKRGALEIHPDTRVTALSANVVHEIGVGLFRWATLIIGGVDNREARLTVNRHAYAVGTPWIDGAIEKLSGVARVFLPPEGACYECSMSALDWRLLEQRRSCSLLNRELVAAGKVPTTPTTASVVAGIQCQEAVKLLHGLPTLGGRGFVFDGLNHESYTVNYQRNPDCMSHEPLDTIVETGMSATTLTLRAALSLVRERMGAGARVEFLRELLRGLDCPACDRFVPLARGLAAVDESMAVCSVCGGRMAPRLYHSANGDEEFLDRTLGELGLPRWDIFVGCSREARIGFELDADRDSVLDWRR